MKNDLMKDLRVFIKNEPESRENGPSSFIGAYLILLKYKNAGMSMEDMSDALTELRIEFQKEEGVEESSQEDFLLDLTDMVTGYCMELQWLYSPTFKPNRLDLIWGKGIWSSM